MVWMPLVMINALLYECVTRNGYRLSRFSSRENFRVARRRQFPELWSMGFLCAALSLHGPFMKDESV